MPSYRFPSLEEVKITALTEKKLHLQIAGTAGSVHALIRLAHAFFSCRKESCVVIVAFQNLWQCVVKDPTQYSLIIFTFEKKNNDLPDCMTFFSLSILSFPFRQWQKKILYSSACSIFQSIDIICLYFRCSPITISSTLSYLAYTFLGG